MTGTLERVTAFVVAPAAPPPAVALPRACRVVVLGGVADAAGLAAAVALTLRAGDRAPAALVALRGAPTPPRGPATRAARRLAAAVTPCTSGVVAARGRLVWLALPDEPADAQAAVLGAAAVVAGPLVTALAGPRPAALDDLVAGHDLAVVAAEPDTALARAAVARLEARGVAATACRPPRRGTACTLAFAGLGAPRLDLGVAATQRSR